MLIPELVHSLRGYDRRQAGADVIAGEIEGTPHAAASGAPPGVEVYEINGPFFFGAAEKFKGTMGTLAKPPRVLILRMSSVLTIESMHASDDLIRRSRRDGTLVLLTRVRSQPMMAMAHRGLLDEIGEDRLYGSLEDAMERARGHVHCTGTTAQ